MAATVISVVNPCIVTPFEIKKPPDYLKIKWLCYVIQ